MKKIIVTGGHLTPALAVMAELKKRGWDVVYAGRKHALEGDAALSQEYLMLQKLQYHFVPINTTKVHRTLSLHGFLSWFKFPVGVLDAFTILNSLKPDRVLSFGGYVAVPIVLAAWLKGVPVITHEQTLSPGLANRLISVFARQICVGWQQIASRFPHHKTVFTGNPLRKELYNIKNTLRIPIDKPLIYITGGSLGSHTINQVVFESIEALTKVYTIVHQTGNSREFKDFERARQVKARLPETLRLRYFPIDYVGSDWIGWLMNKAQVIVGRSGANTVTELVAFMKPSVLIPLPWAGANEQYANATLLADSGGAFLLTQNTLTSETLISAINHVYKEREGFKKDLTSLTSRLVPNAAQKIVEVIES